MNLLFYNPSIIGSRAMKIYSERREKTDNSQPIIEAFYGTVGTF